MAESAIAWVNGRLLDVADATVSAFDPGLLTGDGVFETLRVYRFVPFAARRHLDRLRQSADGMGLDVPERDVLRGAMDSVVAANGLVEGRMRITVTRATVIVAGGPVGPATAFGQRRPWPDAEAVVVVPWPRNERGALAGIKTISYGENVVALAYARGRSGGEAVFANLAGDLCEGSGSNVFVGVGGRLVTPPLSSGCLPGVTRDLLLEVVKVAEEALPVSALADADEAFLTSSTREVQPIATVDGRALPSVPGPLTQAAAAAFAALVASDLDP